MAYNSIYDYEEKGRKYARKYGLEQNPVYPGWNDEVDAFRHAFMQALIYIHSNGKAAKFVGEAYENVAGFIQGQAKQERNMDLWNNKIGREIGKDLKAKFKREKYTQQELEDYLAEIIVKKIKDGDLITHPSDKRKYTGFAADIGAADLKTYTDTNGSKVLYSGENLSTEFLESLTPQKRLIYNTEFNLAETDDKDIVNRAAAQFYNNEKYTKSELDSGVKSGDIIYVEAYVRSDGTKVSGYYRKK